VVGKLTWGWIPGGAGIRGEFLADDNGDAAAGARWAVGPEVAFLPFGLGLQYVGEQVEGQTHHGLGLRLDFRITPSLVIYGRYSLMTGDDTHGFEAGLRFEVPLWWGEERREL
jgi:hypothetical protein